MGARQRAWEVKRWRGAESGTMKSGKAGGAGGLVRESVGSAGLGGNRGARGGKEGGGGSRFLFSLSYQ